MENETRPVLDGPNPQVHPAFVKLLESGEYGQTTKRLAVADKRTKDGRRYCAMGLACEAYRQTTGKGEWLTAAEIKERGLFNRYWSGSYKPTDLLFVTQNELSLIDGESPEYTANMTVPPWQVVKWVGLYQKDQFHTSNTTKLSRVVKAGIEKARKVSGWNSLSVISLNDTVKLKFSTIAKFFREVPLTY